MRDVLKYSTHLEVGSLQFGARKARIRAYRSMGRSLSRWAVDPRIARDTVLLLQGNLSCLYEEVQMADDF